jgi:hypothetical protein
MPYQKGRPTMSKWSLIKRAVASLLLILVGMLIAVAVLSGGPAAWFTAAGPPSAQAAAPSDLTLQSSPDDSFTCYSVGVAAYPSRIHVECSPAAGSIRFFALGTDNAPHAARILSVLSMAHVTGKPLYIQYDPNDTSGANIGCQTSDCRLIQSAAILP